MACNNVARESEHFVIDGAGYATAEESNHRYKFLLAQGQTGLSVAFDLPTQIGYDADDPMALGEVGQVGVSISSLEDMARLFLERSERQASLEGLAHCFPFQALSVVAPARDFYDFYGI